MKKILVSLLILFVLILSSCEEGSVDDADKGNTATIDKTKDNNDDYEKDGDIVHYFKTFGTVGLCGGETDWSNKDCYEIEVEFDDGMTVSMKYYDIEGSVYLTFDITAEKDGASLSTQVDYYLGFDTSVKYYIDETLVEGWLSYNGYDQVPMFEINQDYEYTALGDDAVELMQAMLNDMVVNLDNYFEQNAGGPFISPEAD